MTCVRVRCADRMQSLFGADVSHLAELVRGDFFPLPWKAPSSALRAPSPQGEKGNPARWEFLK